jgi:hypothetical protein
MAPASTIACDLNRLLLPADYASERAQLFPSEPSVRWFIRTNRKRLLNAGALLRIGGRLMIDPNPFDQVVNQVGREIAEAPYGATTSSQSFVVSA